VTQAARVAGSHRDPAGSVYDIDGRILRAIAPGCDAAFSAALRTGMLDRLADSGRVIAFEPVSVRPEEVGLKEADRVLEHPRVPFISYPYEWSFEALKAAALHHLDLHLEAMGGGLTLSDASAYNIQFLGTEPIFIDLLSFRPYQDGEIWAGYRQFCEQFLNPLFLCAKTGVMPNAWYRGALEGIRTAELRKLLPWPALLSRRALLHIVAHAALENAVIDATPVQSAVATATLPRESFLRMLRDLRVWIASLTPKRTRSRWADYRTSCSYSDDERTAKRNEVAEFAAALRPKMLWALGCNTGEYPEVALNAGAAYAVGWDDDGAAIDIAFRSARENGAKFTPLTCDLANPSPSQGWQQAERAGMGERANADAVMALAIIHHLVFSANVPLPKALAWITSLAPRGLIEFVPPDDVQVQSMLARRSAAHPYDRDLFVTTLGEIATIERTKTLGASGRELFWYDRRN